MGEMTKSVIIYLITIFLPVFFSYLYQKYANTKSKKIILFTLIIIIPLLVSTFRYNVGIDYNSYREYYSTIINRYITGIEMPTQLEYGFILLNILSYLIFKNAQGVFLLKSLLFLVFSIGGIIKFKDKISLPISVLIFMTFFYSASFNGVRQLIAVAIIFYSFSYALEKKFVKYLFFVLLACLFHKTAILATFLYFIVPKDDKAVEVKNKIFNFSVIALTLLIPLIKSVIINVFTYLNFYSTYLLDNGDKSLNFLLYIIPPLIIILLYEKKLIKSDYKNLFWIRLMLLQIPLQFAGYYIRYLDRMSLYVSVSQLIIIPLLLKVTNKSNSAYLRLFVIGWYIFYYLFVYVYLNGNGVYPYRYILGL